MFIQRLGDCQKKLKDLHCDELGYQILSLKDRVLTFHIYGLKPHVAAILKQEALACGADLALPRDAIMYAREFYDGILMITRSQAKILIKKLQIQPFGLKQLAVELKAHLKNFEYPLRIMGVINATPDSFYERSRKDSKSAKERILEMIEEGVDIIDIGGASTRPGSPWVCAEEELERVKPIVEFIAQEGLVDKVSFSIDTYTPEVAKLCLDHGFSMVNDITGFTNKKMLDAVRGYYCECVVMHMQKNPKEMQKNPTYENLFLEIDSFFARQIECLRENGNDRIILDVGIGFGKSLEHNCELIKHLEHFCHFGYPLLIGASRKSMIDSITPCSVEDRLAGTLVIHLESLNHGVSILRCHDVKEHVQALKVWERLHRK
ncbi:MAG: dihydropteroate synthase [Helicobacter sp.]|nr:dihydropteroate synthase [Helicobacter sp.]